MEDRAGTRISREDIDRYFLTVSHELKAPLSEILAYVNILEEDCAGILPAQSLQDLRSIRRICGDAMSLVREYMDYSKIQTMEITLERIGFRELLEEIFRDLTTPLRERKIELILPDHLPDIIADRFLLSLLIRNIFANSIKFTSSRKEARISLHYCRKADITRFCFQDNGEGVSEEFAKRAFNLFEKSGSGENTEGTGIGLNLVQRIAERFRGDVTLSSVEGESFSVEVSLPNSMIVMPSVPDVPEKDSGEIRIGVIGATTGDYSEIAPCRRFAYELAVDEINERGGVLGKKLRLFFRDFHSDLEKVPWLAWELAAVDRVDVLMGGQLSSAREYIRDVAHQMKLPYFFNSLYEGGLADHYTFCTANTPEQNVYPMLDQMMGVYGKRCYIIAADYNYGILSSECTRNHIEKKGGSVAGIEYFTPTKTDFLDSIRKINEAAPDILLSFCVGNNQICFHEQWYKYGNLSVPVISTIGVGESHLHKRLPAPILRNTFFMSSYIEELDTKAAMDFTRKIRSRYSGEDISYIEFDAEPAYTSVYLYKKAVEKAGTTDTEAVIHTLENGNIGFDGPGGHVSIRGEDHHAVRDVILFGVNEENRIGKTMFFPGLKTNFVEEALRQEYGRNTSLRELGESSPNIQYNVMYNRIV